MFTNLLTLIFTVIGVSIAGYVAFVQIKDIRQKQTAILKQFKKSPKIKAGFYDPDDFIARSSKFIKTLQIRKLQRATKNQTTALIGLMNDGELSAKDLLINILVPSTIDISITENNLGANKAHDSKQNMVAFTYPVINPGDYISVQCLLTVPASEKDFEVELRVSFMDSKESLHKLKVLN